jgi:hypothetical protein
VEKSTPRSSSSLKRLLTILGESFSAGGLLVLLAQMRSDWTRNQYVTWTKDLLSREP